MNEGIPMIKVRFTHPRDAVVYVAEVSPNLTARGALEALSSVETGPFLSPLQPSENFVIVLRRTGQVLSSNMTMGDVGVVAGDILDVGIMGQGAGWVEILAIAASIASIAQVILMITDKWSRKAGGKKHIDKFEAKEAKPWDEVKEILILMTDSTWVSFKIWKTDPDKVKSFIQTFDFSSGSPKPKQVMFVLKNGYRVRVDISDSLMSQQELDKLLKYLKLDFFPNKGDCSVSESILSLALLSIGSWLSC